MHQTYPCMSCVNYAPETGACSVIHENVRLNPKRFLKKCIWKYYEHDEAKDERYQEWKTEVDAIAQNKDVGGWSFFFASLSIIPLIGLIPAMISLVWGLIKIKHRGLIVLLIAFSGTMLSMVIPAIIALIIIGNHGFQGLGSNDWQIPHIENDLAILDKNIELYHERNNVYPDSLRQVLRMLTLEEKLELFNKDQGKMLKAYHYEHKEPGEYLLFFVGFDYKPFTDDDIYPVENDSL